MNVLELALNCRELWYCGKNWKLSSHPVLLLRLLTPLLSRTSSFLVSTICKESFVYDKQGRLIALDVRSVLVLPYTIFLRYWLHFCWDQFLSPDRIEMGNALMRFVFALSCAAPSNVVLGKRKKCESVGLNDNVSCLRSCVSVGKDLVIDSIPPSLSRMMSMISEQLKICSIRPLVVPGVCLTCSFFMYFKVEPSSSCSSWTFKKSIAVCESLLRRRLISSVFSKLRFRLRERLLCVNLDRMSRRELCIDQSRLWKGGIYKGSSWRYKVPRSLELFDEMSLRRFGNSYRRDSREWDLDVWEKISNLTEL